jgi:hypothetical protein
MTRWSIRRRIEADQDAAQAYRPGAGAPVGAQPPATQSTSGQQAEQAEELHQAGWRQASWARASSLGWKDRAEAAAADGQPAQVPEQQANAWPDICDQFGLHMLVLAEQLRASLDELEADEGDPERLQRLYQVDHAVTRMRRASRDLRILAGRSEEELAGFTTSLLDVIRMAASAIERYRQVSVGRVTDLAVLGYAADDVGSLVAALLDNATRYSPGTVTVSGHLLDDGAVMFRIEDSGIGIGDEQITQLNAGFAGPVAEVDEKTGRHTGFPVVRRIALKHSIGVRLASRPAPNSGTVAMVTLPPHLLCELPVEEAQRVVAPAAKPAQREAAGPARREGPGAGRRAGGGRDVAGPGGQEVAGRPSVVPELSRRERSAPPTATPAATPTGTPAGTPAQRAAAAGATANQEGDRGTAPAAPNLPAELPRRQRTSLRGDEPRRRAAAAQAPAPAMSAEQQAAARRAFAADLDAFTQGSMGAGDGAGDARNIGETSRVEDTVSEQGSLYQEGTVL